MKDVTLGFKAFDLHELTCHFVARHAGIYAANGLTVNLLDTRSIPDGELPRSIFSAACAFALMRWLRGERVKVLFVASTRPMFWLYARNDIESIERLAGQRIAGYPSAAPPAQFLRIVLEDAGLRPEADVTIEPAGDDASRLAMLQSGEAGAALLSSATSPSMAEKPEFRLLSCLGDRIRVPTTGLAADSVLYESDPDSVLAMRRSFTAAIRLVHRDDAVLRESLREAALVRDRHVGAACARIREFYSANGRIRHSDVLPGVQRLARCLHLPIPGRVDDLYCGISPA